jgi:hypothetical protein
LHLELKDNAELLDQAMASTRTMAAMIAPLNYVFSNAGNAEQSVLGKRHQGNGALP